MRLKGAGDEDIVSRGQLEATRHFSQVDERLASGQGGVVPEKVPAQVSILVLVGVRALQGESSGHQGDMTLVSILNSAGELAVYCGPEFRSNKKLKALAGTLRAAGPLPGKWRSRWSACWRQTS